MRLLAHRYSNNWWFIILRVIFFLFPGLPHSEMLGVAAVIFSPPLRYWMLWKCWSFSLNLLHWVSWAGCASLSRITENTILGPGESSQNILTAIFRSAGRAKVSPGVSGLNCNIVKTEREREAALVLGWAREILGVSAGPGCQSSGPDPRMWKISLFYLNRILNFNSESITGIILYGIL